MVSTPRFGVVLALPAVLLVGLSGCGLFTPAGSDEPRSAIQQCAMGHTWTLNIDDLAEQVQAALTKDGVVQPTVTAAGTQTFVWELNGDVSVETDYQLDIASVPAADRTVKLTQTHRGSATGQIFINGEVAIPRNWDGTGLAVETTSEVDGAVVEAPPYPVPPTDFDDAVGLELTCDGGTLTTHPRGSDVTQTWTKD